MLELPINSKIVLPADSLRFVAVRSSGPGGQHVNKTSSKVQLRFDLPGCDALTDEERDRVREQMKNRLGRDGWIQVECQVSRFQHRNLEEARGILASLLNQALHVDTPRKATRTPRGAIRRRLDHKRRRSDIKRARGAEYD